MRNSDGFAYPTSDRYSCAWRALEGTAVLFGPYIDAEGNLYACTGRGEGFAHLHSFTPDGSLRWESPPRRGIDTLGARVSPFAPLLDGCGGVYVADELAFWCFETDGRVRWRTDLAELGVRGGFPSAVLSPSGHVGGISLDGVALFLHPHSGEPAFAPLALPIGPAPAALDVPHGLWEGMMEPATRNTIFPAFFGRGFPVTNSPAVSPATGMTYITVAAESLGRTRLVAVREARGALEALVLAEFEGYCSVTPSISTDGLTVYTGNHKGELLAFDAARGDLRWRYSPAATAASPTVGLDGTVYSGCTVAPGIPSQLSAIDPETGRARWCRNYDELAKELLEQRPLLENLFPDPSPHASINSVPTVSETHLLVVMTLGYTFTPPGQGPMTQPHRAVLASIDPSKGELLGYAQLPDSSEAAVVLAADGSVYTPHAALTSSLFHALNAFLPPSHQTNLVPRGGLTKLEPKNPAARDEDG
jgi:outer membrane protein assembly factor BamB